MEALLHACNRMNSFILTARASDIRSGYQHTSYVQPRLMEKETGKMIHRLVPDISHLATDLHLFVNIIGLRAKRLSCRSIMTMTHEDRPYKAAIC